MKPAWRRNAALALVVATLIGWPLSATTDVRAEQDGDNEK